MAIQYDLKKDGIKAELKISIPYEDYKNEFDKIFNKYYPRITIKGFRKGKAPKGLVLKKFGEELKNETISTLFENSLESYLKEKKEDFQIYPGSLKIKDKKNEEIKENIPIEFTVEFELMPEVEIGELEEVEVEKYKILVNDKDIENEIEAYKKSYTTLEVKPEESSIEEEDIVYVEIEGFDTNGEKIFEKKDETISLRKYNGKYFLPYNLDHSLFIGKRKGDVIETEIEFDEKISEDVLKNKKVKFKIKIKEIKAFKLPEINDEFVKEYTEFKTVEEWKEEIKKQLEIIAKNEEEILNFNIIIKKIAENSKFLIPETMISQYTEYYVDKYLNQIGLRRENLSNLLKFQNTTEEEFYNNIKESVINDIKKDLIISELKNKFKLKPTEDEIVEYYKKNMVKTSSKNNGEDKENGKNEENNELKSEQITLKDLNLSDEERYKIESAILADKFNKLFEDKIKVVKTNEISLSDLEKVKDKIYSPESENKE